MKEIPLTFPEIGMINGTRFVIGTGLGLLLSEKMDRHTRKELRLRSRPFRPPDHSHLSVPNLEDVAQIIDVGQNELQVSQLTRPPKEIDAPTAQTCAGRRIAPSLDHLGSL